MNRYILDVLFNTSFTHIVYHDIVNVFDTTTVHGFILQLILYLTTHILHAACRKSYVYLIELFHLTFLFRVHKKRKNNRLSRTRVFQLL